ncbi:MAG: family 10 glycosylhydrolase [Bacteroidales bacterium]|nr:family 10 glycosylhydrolase [Bacteroidales bacterium]
MKRNILFFVALILCASLFPKSPKREFRGAWIQCVNGQFQGLSAQQMQQKLTNQLNACQQAGINAIIFQVRAEADALYASSLEPWSRFLSGVQGQHPGWDPLQWMIAECHRRGMELHAWINPYRALTKSTSNPAYSHPTRQHPDWFFRYNGQLYFNPALRECREWICRIVLDIISRYDVDAIHMDDYFYPYPAAGEQIPDTNTFNAYRGSFTDIGNWRRNNVNMLIRDLHQLIADNKPWVKLGISPFGIYRNQSTDPQGSRTNGLQNYDNLYADILLWVNNGWVDYNIPQIYWENGNRAADYDTLIRWWNDHASKRPLFIGQDVLRTVKHGDMQRKMQLQRSMPNVQGSCQWYADALIDNPGGYTQALVGTYHRYPALIPTSPFIDPVAPQKVKKLKVVWTADGPVLFWTARQQRNEFDRTTRFVVYRFLPGERVNLDDPSKIIAITPSTFLPLSYQGGEIKYTYVVTALDRLHNESKAAKRKVRL